MASIACVLLNYCYLIARRFHLMVVTIPIKTFTFEGWYRMKEFYFLSERLYMTANIQFSRIRDTFSRIMEQAFRSALSTIKTAELCTNCNNVTMHPPRLNSIRYLYNISDLVY